MFYVTHYLEDGGVVTNGYGKPHFSTCSRWTEKKTSAVKALQSTSRSFYAHYVKKLLLNIRGATVTLTSLSSTTNLNKSGFSFSIFNRGLSVIRASNCLDCLETCKTGKKNSRFNKGFQRKGETKRTGYSLVISTSKYVKQN